MKDLFIVTKTEWLGKIDETLEVQNIEFHGNMLEITKTVNSFRITNAMDGWGDNIKSDYENAEIYISE